MEDNRGKRKKGRTYKILVDEEKCVGCQRCQLICSILYNDRFNPAMAWIVVMRNNDYRFNISFTDECTKCGLCAKGCCYGCLGIEEGVQSND